jgi:benzylsuccinate CoA-transferase BbsE subunit
MSRALDGVRVLDLTDRSAALTGRLLADLGAEVILVEPPSGTPARRLAPWLDGATGPEASLVHQYLNANKKSVVIDLESDEARNDLLRLAASADVVIDTAVPGSLDALGLSHAELRSVNPGLIQCSVTPFGLDSPWRQRRANDLVAGATSGLIWMSGEPRGVPVQGGADPSHAMASLHALSAISIALHQRDHSGEGVGVHIDLSVQEASAMAVMQSATPTIWTWQQRIPRRPGLSNALRCADGGYVGQLVRPDRFE